MATVKSGYLQKLSGFFKRNWKKQYFVLHQDGKLLYCEQAGEEYSTGHQVNVKYGCHRIDYGYEVEVDAQNKAADRAACLFSINTTQKTIFLLADTEQDARDWVQKLK
ncbi:hypothetical protein, partial [Salmonella sp. s54925]|uniref:hypothetical protein n=1 Tax=Salmonella sp. s54925 TaxID=3159674 RepID=UPI003980A817